MQYCKLEADPIAFGVLPKQGEMGDALLPLYLLLACGLRPLAGLCSVLLQPRLAIARHAYKWLAEARHAYK